MKPIALAMLIAACAAPPPPVVAPDASAPVVIGEDASVRAVTCGACTPPLECGAQDLGWYRPEPGECGLGCRVVAMPSARCPRGAPVEHACPYSPELGALVASDEWPYPCRLVPPMAAGAPDLHFCCAL